MHATIYQAMVAKLLRDAGKDSVEIAAADLEAMDRAPVTFYYDNGRNVYVCRTVKIVPPGEKG